VRDCVIFVMVVLFLNDLSGSVLLRSLLWWHRELFYWLQHGGRQCWGVRKSDGVPEHKVHEQDSQELRNGDKESPKACTRLKSCESLYTCPGAPFYRETKGLLHSENTLEIQGILLVWTCTWMSFTSRDLRC
jgi:hypothetical protein